MRKYITTEKLVGETPLQALGRMRTEYNIPYYVPLAYAGRLDPMASGKLLALVGDECKQQNAYHALDKTYDFEVLFGIRSDTGDILGRVEKKTHLVDITTHELTRIARELVGPIALPYPHFSSKTVRGKPLHIWALEGRLDEIEIPVRHSHIYSLTVTSIDTIGARELYEAVSTKIETIPPVTEKSKVLGADFRRTDVRAHWKKIYESDPHALYTVASCTTTVSSGTYIRSLAPLIAERLGTYGLAYSIHRTRIGNLFHLGPIRFWYRTY